MSQILITGRLFTVLLFFTKNAWFKWKHPRAFVAIKARIVEKEYASSEEFVAHTQKRLTDTHAHVRRFSVMNRMDLAALASPPPASRPLRPYGRPRLPLWWHPAPPRRPQGRHVRLGNQATRRQPRSERRRPRKAA